MTNPPHPLHPLRKAVMNDSVNWQPARITSNLEFKLMNTYEEVHEQRYATKVETQMWMLFFAEMFEND